jgi:hypothetical protein
VGGCRGGEVAPILDPGLDRDQHASLELADLQNLGASPFILVDPVEDMDWCHYHEIMGGVAHLLNAAMVAANDMLKQLNSAANPYEVRCAHALVAASCFAMSSLCSFRSH